MMKTHEYLSMNEYNIKDLKIKSLCQQNVSIITQLPQYFVSFKFCKIEKYIVLHFIA